MIVSIISSKGGVGRSTLSYNLAVRLDREGLYVCIADRDHNRTCRDWNDNRQRQVRAGQDLPHIDVHTLADANLKGSLRSLRREYQIVIIDGMSTLDNANVKIIDNSDYILIPMQPSPIDFSALDRFYPYIQDCQEERGGFTTGLVLNHFDPQVCTDWIFRKNLRKHPLNTFAQRISSYPIYKESFLAGMGIIEMYDNNGQLRNPSAVREFELFFQALFARLRKQRGNYRW